MSGEDEGGSTGTSCGTPCVSARRSSRGEPPLTHRSIKIATSHKRHGALMASRGQQAQAAQSAHATPPHAGSRLRGPCWVMRGGGARGSGGLYRAAAGQPARHAGQPRAHSVGPPRFHGLAAVWSAAAPTGARGCRSRGRARHTPGGGRGGPVVVRRSGAWALSRHAEAATRGQRTADALLLYRSQRVRSRQMWGTMFP